MAGAIGVETYIVLAEAVTLFVGGFVTFLAGRAYLRTGSPALRALAVGLGLVTVGGLLAGAVHQMTGVDLVGAIAIRSTFTAAGFLVLAYSLYARHADDEDDRRPAPT